MIILNLSRKILLLSTGFLLSFATLLFFFLFIDPSDRSLVFIFVPVVLFWLMLFFTAQIFIKLLAKDHRKLYNTLAIIGISTIVLLLLLSGIGQLSVADIVLTICLCAICSFYFYRSWD